MKEFKFVSLQDNLSVEYFLMCSTQRRAMFKYKNVDIELFDGGIATGTVDAFQYQRPCFSMLVDCVYVISTHIEDLISYLDEKKTDKKQVREEDRTTA